MPILHLFLILSVVLIWGCNFIAVDVALKDLPPLFLCALRFLLASFPAILFFRPSREQLKMIALYGLVTFGLQFSLLFFGMHVGMTPGVASILLQVQVFFSILFAVLFLKESLNIWQIIGAVISFSGIGLIGMHFDKSISVVGFIFIIAAAAAWGAGNLITKKLKNVNMMTLVSWGSFSACFPILLFSLVLEGPHRIAQSMNNMTSWGMISVLYIVYASTWVGYGLWNWLVTRHKVATIVPFTLLVPIIGMMSSVLILGEPLQTWKLVAGALVMAGLCINLFGNRLNILINRFYPDKSDLILQEEEQA